MLNDEVDGGLLLAYEEPTLFTEEDQQTARSFADHAALAIANALLRSQAEELAVTAERSRLARDLHDAVTQTLFATSLIADVLPRLWERNPEAGKQKLAEIRQLTRGALAEMRTLLMELRPAALEDVPLPDLLQQLSEAFTGRARVPVALEIDRSIQLPPHVKIGFYRIAQEALNNISKHARARTAQIQLSRTSGSVQMMICDDGIGFDPHKIQPDHFGLGIMEERAQSVGAQYEMNSVLDNGTQVKVYWKIESEAE
jgi:signal transduction histidine kinase